MVPVAETETCLGWELKPGNFHPKPMRNPNADGTLNYLINAFTKDTIARANHNLVCTV
jgi:hypothetical protein